jgi:hypothetical protein
LYKERGYGKRTRSVITACHTSTSIDEGMAS